MSSTDGIRLMRGLSELFRIQHPYSGKKQDTLDGIVEGCEYLFTEEPPISDLTFYSLNRIIRNKKDLSVPPGKVYRDINIEITRNNEPLGSAVEPQYLEGLMSQLIYNTAENPKLSDIEKAALTFGGIFAIQPFGDGNKRTGFIAANYSLIKNGKKPFILKEGISDKLKEFWTSMSEWEDFRKGISLYDSKKYSTMIDLISTQQI